MDKLQADKLTEIRKSLEAATPGEWSVEEDDYGLTVMAADPQHPGRSAGVFGFDSEIYVREEDVDLIAHAPEYITYLLQLVETQAQALEEAQNERFEYEKLAAKNQEEGSRLRRALGWYANEGSWIQGEYQGGLFFTVAEIDGGQRAREALTQV